MGWSMMCLICGGTGGSPLPLLDSGARTVRGRPGLNSARERGAPELPAALDAGGGNPARSRHPARAPMSSALWHRLQCCDDHRFDFGIIDRARHARTWLVMEAVQPLRDETGSPFAHRLRRDFELPRNHLVGITRCAAQHDAGSQRQSLGRRSPPGQAPQRNLQPRSK